MQHTNDYGNFLEILIFLGPCLSGPGNLIKNTPYSIINIYTTALKVPLYYNSLFTILLICGAVFKVPTIEIVIFSCDKIKKCSVYERHIFLRHIAKCFLMKEIY